MLTFPAGDFRIRIADEQPGPYLNFSFLDEDDAPLFRGGMVHDQVQWFLDRGATVVRGATTNHDD